MRAFAGFLKFKFRTASNYLVTVVDECLKYFFQIECARTTIDESHIVDAERRLHCSELVQLVENHVCVRITFECDNNAHTVAIAFVV